jgi:hypothetical protein
MAHQVFELQVEYSEMSEAQANAWRAGLASVLEVLRNLRVMDFAGSLPATVMEVSNE